ncbi:MAG: hypothetical protein GX666_01020 [Tissierellia bacterium]|nr:hypothetical protein [Tissierellia bacterium]
MDKKYPIAHLGKVRGGTNTYARFFLHILPDDEDCSYEEILAIFERWDEEFGLQGNYGLGWYYKINTRREFALVPSIIRKAQRVGFKVFTSMWDIGEGKYYLHEQPAEFWRALALAQAFYGE